MIHHRCKCDSVARCDIFTHPSSKVQTAINELMDAMAEFDDERDATSILFFKSTHGEGVFTTITLKDAVQEA